MHTKDMGLIPESGRFPWRRAWQPIPVFLSGKFHGHRSLVSYSPWGHKELDTTEPAHVHTAHPHTCRRRREGKRNGYATLTKATKSKTKQDYIKVKNFFTRKLSIK